jgi:hypothetical protein
MFNGPVLKSSRYSSSEASEDMNRYLAMSGRPPSIITERAHGSMLADLVS